jgi:hypothetical protein
MAGKLRPQVEERLLRSSVLPKFFDMQVIETLWKRHLSQQDSTPKIWNLLFLEEWMRQHGSAL